MLRLLKLIIDLAIFFPRYFSEFELHHYFTNKGTKKRVTNLKKKNHCLILSCQK